MPHRLRLLGFAFANADLLFEIERDGKVLFATGAEKVLRRDGSLVGAHSGDFFEPREGARFISLARQLNDGGRLGPTRLKLAGGTDVDIAMCRLPHNNGRISCTLTYPGSKQFEAPSLDAETGISNADAFMSDVAAKATERDRLSLVEVDALSNMPKQVAADALSRIGKAIGKAGVGLVGRVSETQFGAVVERGVNFAEIVRSALREGGLGKIEVAETLVSLKSNGLSTDQRMLALRYAVEQATRTSSATASGDLSSAFESAMRETEVRAAKLMATISDGGFSLAYQPIVNLKTNAVAHYEALSRFDNANTQEMVVFAEQIGVADAFDVAVALKAIAAMESLADRSPHVAINVSGHTLANASSFGLLAGLLARHRRIADHVLIEITETAAITDLVNANKAIQSLREMGFKVGLDDFGAGAASFQYLHAFSVDFVKVDGSLVKNIGRSERDDLLLRSIIKLCDELKVETIAEYVSDDIILKRVREMGFTLGQGHHFAKASPELPPAMRMVAKRKGAKEQWG